MLLISSKNPPLILGNKDNEIWLNYGHIELTDLSFKALGRDDLVISYSQMQKLLRTAMVRQPQLLVEFAALSALINGGREIVDEMVSFVSQDPSVASAIVTGFVSGGVGGITGVEGTLNLPFGLGSASDTVLTVVLPSLEKVTVVAEGDPPNEHDSPLQLRNIRGDLIYVSGHITLSTIARSSIRLGKKFEKYDEKLDEFLPGGTEGVLKGSFDTTVPFSTGHGGTDLRVTGRVLETEDQQASAVTFEDVVIAFPLAGLFPQEWEIKHKPGTPSERPHAASFLSQPGLDELWVPLTAVGGLTGEDVVQVSVDITGLGAKTGTRLVVVSAVDEDETGTCVAAPPILHVGGGTLPGAKAIAELDRRFVAEEAPIPGVEAVASPFATVVSRAAHGYGKIRSVGAVVPASGRAPAGWVYAIEVPVNDPKICDLHLQRSVAAGEGVDVRNIGQTNQRGRSSLPHAIARYGVPVDGKAYAFVYAGAYGWPSGAGAAKRVGGLEERLSVFDTSDGSYVATAVHALRLMVDAATSPPVFVDQVLVGSSSGKVGLGFVPPAPDAAEQLRALPPLKP